MQPFDFVRQSIRMPDRGTLTDPSIKQFNLAQADSTNQLSHRNRETKNRARRLREDHYTPEKFRMECVGKTCCAATESAACRRIRLFVLCSLELAKGFEPLTL